MADESKKTSLTKKEMAEIAFKNNVIKRLAGLETKKKKTPMKQPQVKGLIGLGQKARHTLS